MINEYYLYTTESNDRWDKIAYKFYGDCYDFTQIISENPHVQVLPTIKEGIQIKIPVIENSQQNTNLPIWKQNIQ